MQEIILAAAERERHLRREADQIRHKRANRFAEAPRPRFSRLRKRISARHS